jgi:cobalt-zinc-cadmium efflux system membrane fusion protein
MGVVARIGGLVAAVVIIAAGAYALLFPLPWHQASSEPAKPGAAESARAPNGDAATANSVTLSDAELKAFKVEAVDTREFGVSRDAVGKIAFNDDASVPVFPPYQGRIAQLFAKPGDDVKKGQVMFEIDSPDLVNAESNLISAVGTFQQTKGQLDLTTRALARGKALLEAKAIAQKDLEQATADFTAADGAYKAAVGGLKIDSRMPVASPIAARVTSRQAGPGQFVQPGGNPVYTVADISTVWMIAKVAETDIPLVHVGQQASVKVMAYPGRLFRGKITYIAASVDPDTHRVLVRSEIPDPKFELLPEMFATFVIRTGEAFTSPAVPEAGVVREGDGTMTVWVTADRRRFDKRTVRIGLQQGGFIQILEGLQPGELLATDGALFLSNALTTASK